MKKLSTLLILLSTTGLLLAAPSTPITRGRLTTDLDAGGHSITNGPMATTNFVWDAVASVTNNLPQGGGTDGEAVTNIVNGLVESALDGVIRAEDLGNYTGDIVTGGRVSAGAFDIQGNTLGTAAYKNTGDFAASTNLPALPASATVGDLVDRVNAVIGALHE